MFNRSKKITSLLVAAAAAVVSMVPAYAADVKKIESQDGTVYNAIAYKDGEFYIDGEINDKDEASYYVANGKYSSLSDIDSGSDVHAYGSKYVEVQDGDYYVDLSTGKVTDDSIAEDARDDAGSNLRKKVKADTDGRYLKDASSYAGDSLQTITSSNEISGPKFGGVWYYTALANKNATNGYTANGNGSKAATLNVFADGSGNYIDADYNLGKIKVTTTVSGSTTTKSVYVDNTNDEYDTASSKAKVTASIRQKKVLATDKDYIYRTATVTLQTNVTTGAGVTVGISQVYGKNTSCSAFNVSNSGATVSFDVVQKISKAQNSSEIGGAKYAKTVTSYLISDDNAVSKTDFESYTYWTAVDRKLTGYNTSASSESDNIKVQTAQLKSSDGLYYTDLGDSSTEDTSVYSSSKVAIDKDADGNLWRLDSGYVYEWDNDSDWNKVYKVDGSFDELSVYDKNNIVAWNEDDEVYSVIGGKKSDDKTTDPVPVTVTTGWVQATDGTWAYNKADGTKATGWVQDGSNWYYTNAAGIMQTGWQNVGGTWYYLNPSSDGTKGAMKTGWQNISGTWYYLNPISDGTRGAMKTGWINDNGTWYYCNSSGAMLANTTVNGYVLGSNGAWIR